MATEIPTPRVTASDAAFHHPRSAQPSPAQPSPGIFQFSPDRQYIFFFSSLRAGPTRRSSLASAEFFFFFKKKKKKKNHGTEKKRRAITIARPTNYLRVLLYMFWVVDFTIVRTTLWPMLFTRDEGQRLK